MRLAVIVVIVIALMSLWSYGSHMRNFDPTEAYFGQNWGTATEKQGTGWLGLMFDRILSGFNKPAPPPKIVQFKVGDCVDLATLSGDTRFGMSMFRDGEFYDSKYQLGDVISYGRFKYSMQGKKGCWQFMGNVDQTCGAWKFASDAMDPCPFEAAKCQSLTSYFGDFHRGTRTFPDGSSYEYKDGYIVCSKMAQ